MQTHESGKSNLNFPDRKVSGAKSCIALWLLSAIFLISAVAQEARLSGTEQPSTPRVINIWPGVAPGSEQWKQQETIVGSAGNQRIMNVSTPTLAVYLPDPSTATGTAVIIAPGGGFVWLSINSEGHDVAKWLAARGIAGIVLKYRLFQVEGQDSAQVTQAATRPSARDEQPQFD